jgi:HD domain
MGDEESSGIAHIKTAGFLPGHNYAAQSPHPSPWCTVVIARAEATIAELAGQRLRRSARTPARSTPSAETTAGLDQRVTLLVVGLAIVACAILVAEFSGFTASLSEKPGQIATLLGLTLVLQMFSVQVYGRGSVSVSAIGILASAFLFDTGTTMAIAVLATVAQSIRRRSEIYKAVFDAANFAVSAAAASLVFQALSDWRLLAAVLAGVAFAVMNNGLLCLAMSFAEHTSARTIWFERFHWARYHFALFGPIAFAATVAYEQTGTVGLAAFALPPALMILSVRQYLERTAVAVEEIRQANLSLRRAHKETIAALSRSMEAKDLYTGGHTERVAAVAVGLARRLGYRDEELEAIEIGALLHDIGKIGIPESVLRKPGKLNDDEWELIKTHPVISDYILSELDLHPFVRQCARSSHERIDGMGYPDGLASEAIPLPARIVLVADALDALTSTRSYRAARPFLGALAEIRAHTGTQFCPRVVAALEELWRSEPNIFGPELLKQPRVA